MIDRTQVATVLGDLVKIESINPELVAAGSGEAEIARYVADFLHGFAHALNQAS